MPFARAAPTIRLFVARTNLWPGDGKRYSFTSSKATTISPHPSLLITSCSGRCPARVPSRSHFYPTPGMQFVEQDSRLASVPLTGPCRRAN